jgi:hypothetical protein
MKKYSVLLLYPDYYGDYGHENYLAHVMAETPGKALKAAREKCISDNPPIDEPEDLLCMLLTEGHLEDLAYTAETELTNA